MKLNVHIVSDELKIPQDKLFVDRSYELNLVGFEVINYGTDENLSSEILYIADASEIVAYKKLFNNINFLVVGYIENSLTETLRRQSCNILIVEGRSKAAIVNSLQNVFNKYSSWNERVLEACFNSKSIDDIFYVIVEVLKNPLFILDSASVLILTAGKVPEIIQNTLWKYLLPHGYFLTSKFAYECKALKYMKHFKSREPIWLKAGDTEYPFMSVFLDSLDEPYGEITVVETYEALTLGQFSLLNHIKKLTEYQIKFSVDNTLRSEDSTYVFTQLIRGVFVDESLIENQLKKRCWEIEDKYYVLCLMKNKTDDEQFTTDLNKAQFDQYFPNGIILVFKQYIVIILKEKDYSYMDESNYKEFKDYLVDFNLVCGVSQVFDDLKELHTYYKQSYVSVIYGKRLVPNKNLYYFREFYFDYLIEELKPSVKWSIICDPRVIDLKRYDEKNNTEFMQTLYLYLKSGSNPQETANLLFIHRNTLINRLRQIKDIANINMETNEDIDQLIISCMLMLKNEME